MFSEDIVVISCPFCGREVRFADVAEKPTDKPVGAAIHEMPMCAKFEELSADRFAEACRKARAAS